MRPTLIAVVLASVALSIAAQSTPRDFARGPAQWLMTGEELIEVVFIYDGPNGAARRDPQRTGFTMALPFAIKRYIVLPLLTTVPDWASSRLKRVPANDVESKPEVETTVVTTEKKTQVIIDVPPPVAKPAGMGRLMLLHDSMALQPQSGTDPFTAFSSVAQFKKSQELGWAAEYCAGEILADAPTVKVQLRITAANGDTVSTDPEEFVPDSIKASAGCYLLRGALPLSDLDQGPYKLMVTISGVSATRSYNLTRDFRIE